MMKYSLLFLFLCILTEFNCVPVNVNNFRRVKRQERQYRRASLLREFPVIAQRDEYWCVPGTMEAVMRYIGLVNPGYGVPTGVNSQYYQSHMAIQVRTNPTTGTHAGDILTALNGHMARSTRNDRYSMSAIAQWPAEDQMAQIHQLIYNTLSHDLPVIVLRSGSVGPGFNNPPTNPLFDDSPHALAITEILIDQARGRGTTSDYAIRPQDVLYRVRDPHGPRTYLLDAAHLNFFFTPTNSGGPGGFILHRHEENEECDERQSNDRLNGNNVVHIMGAAGLLYSACNQ